MEAEARIGLKIPKHQNVLPVCCSFVSVFRPEDFPDYDAGEYVGLKTLFVVTPFIGHNLKVNTRVCCSKRAFNTGATLHHFLTLN